MIMTPQQYTKLYKKLLKNKWYDVLHDGHEFKYRLISFCDIDMFNNRVNRININIEVKDFKWKESRKYLLDARYRNRTIRNYFTYYQSESEVDTMLKIVGLDTTYLKVKSLKIK